MAATLNVNPNRMELLKLKRRHAFAVRGHKLLKDKQETLMQMFMQILKDLKGGYHAVTDEWNGVLDASVQSHMGAEPFAMEEALLAPLEPVKIGVTTKKQLGGKLPVFELSHFNPEQRFGSAAAPLALDGMLDRLYVVFPKWVHLAQVEKQIEILSEEIEKTRRRVNALEYNLIPALTETIRGIVMKLEERDRFERTTLMKVKDSLEKANQ